MTLPRPRTFPLILAAPSGAGKTSIAHALRERRPDVVFSVSATTRPPRIGEVHGRDYWFVDEPEFRRMEGAGELVEWATVHDHLYGTPWRNVEEAVAQGRFLLLDIDVQGARQIRERIPDAVSIFVLPPSATTLADRLFARGSEDQATRQRRLRAAAEELRAAPGFDYVVVNDRLDLATEAVRRILESESRRTSRISGLAAACEQIAAEVRAKVVLEGTSPSHTQT